MPLSDLLRHCPASAQPRFAALRETLINSFKAVCRSHQQNTLLLRHAMYYNNFFLSVAMGQPLDTAATYGRKGKNVNVVSRLVDKSA